MYYLSDFCMVGEIYMLAIKINMNLRVWSYLRGLIQSGLGAVPEKLVFAISTHFEAENLFSRYTVNIKYFRS